MRQAGTIQRRGTIRSLWGGTLLLAVAAALLVPSGGSARSQVAPKNTGEPSVSGSPVQGSTLTTSNGSWTSTTPITYQYRWLRCDTTGGGVNGVNCATIAGETRKTYVLTKADVGHRIRSRVIATNQDGTASANSNATNVVKGNAGPPKSAQPPRISGTATENNTLTANKGTWTGAATISYRYQWLRCDQTGGSCSGISGATGSTYALKAVDVGNTLRVRVTAKNSQGSASATSAPTAVVAKAEAPVGSAIAISEVSLPNRLIIDRYSFQPNRLRRHGRVTARFHVSDSRNHSVMGALVFVEGVPLGQVLPSHVEQPTGPDGYATFSLRASSRLQFRGSNRFAFFVRARKAGEDPLGGVSARRLVAVRLG
jgi:Ig domain of plant-specific actin-binding protein